MIIKYNTYREQSKLCNESLKDKIVGKSTDEIVNMLNNIDIKKIYKPEEFMSRALHSDSVIGMMKAIETGKIDIHIENDLYLRWSCMHGKYNIVKKLINMLNKN